jgi:phosphoadenosine phosphosulfate reductase
MRAATSGKDDPMAGEPTVTTALLDELAEQSAAFESATPGEILRWARERFGSDIVYACSFQDIVLIDLLAAEGLDIPVIFLDTEDHFSETWEFVNEVVNRYDLELLVTTPGPEAATVPCGADGCCQLRKVEPLKRAVAGRPAWITGLKRCDAPTRSAAPIVSWDDVFGLVKINPLATWSVEEIASFERDRELLIHPLISQGYLSIGCASTTQPVRPGQDSRSGRWVGSDKTECGLHEA